MEAAQQEATTAGGGGQQDGDLLQELVELRSRVMELEMLGCSGGVGTDGFLLGPPIGGDGTAEELQAAVERGDCVGGAQVGVGGIAGARAFFCAARTVHNPRGCVRFGHPRAST